MIPVSDATLVTTAPTIIPRTGNGPNWQRASCGQSVPP
jgi:hypothetical protein